MKAIITLLILTAVCFSQAPGNWGPGGIPTDWRGSGIEFMEASKFVSAAGANIGMHMASSAAADSVVYTRTGTAGDYNFVWKYVDESGNVVSLRYDDGLNLIASSGTLAGSPVQCSTIGNRSTFDLKIDAGFSGKATCTIGETGDADICWINSLGRLQGTVADSTYTAGAVEQIWIEQSAADTVYLPATPTLGDWFKVKFTNASGGILNGNGKTIDGDATVSATENDAFDLIYNGTEWGIW